MKRKLALVLVALLVATTALSACGKNKDKDSTTTTTTKEQGEVKDKVESTGTLVIGTDQFNGVFSPFFATTAYDVEIADRVMGKYLISNDRLGAPIDGIAKYVAPEEVKDADGNITKTVYTFELIEGVKFSDGTPITADDILFTYKVFCDPTYDGSATIYTTPILGVQAYKYDDPNYEAAIAAIAEKVAAYAPTIEEITPIAQEWADDNAMPIEDFLPEGGYYAYTLDDATSRYKAQLEKEYIAGNLASGEVKVPEIEGIKKINDTTVEVTIDGVDPKAIWNLGGIQIAPAKYYGEGFKKGDLSMVKAKNDSPMGAGPYKFESYENNVITLVTNENYFLGQPVTAKMKYQVTATANKLDGVVRGDTDLSDPTASPEMIEQIDAAGMHYELLDNLGYGYIGINAQRINDLNVRKGLMHLMNRAPAVKSYYDDLATVIERPMSRVSWAYPEGATEYYGFDTAKALEYFLAAGYTQDGGKLMKDGKQLRVEVGIGGDGNMDHPSAPILTAMKIELEKLGGILDISDVDSSILFDRLDAGEWDMWVAAWQATIDPDMYQTYYSDGPSNHYKVNDARLDEVIVLARQTNDVSVRKELYTEALDIIMDQAVEMPVYQRMNLYVFNPNRIDIDTLPADMTAFYGWSMDIQTLQAK
ncbi:MAG: transporter substrate-binding protein [Clostridiales bacterium]|jgi:peptide/nickel transport system substrate-binding protein|nr:transporter substrate-binding protein [Clostridiales bacterium]